MLGVNDIYTADLQNQFSNNVAPCYGVLEIVHAIIIINMYNRNTTNPVSLSNAQQFASIGITITAMAQWLSG